MPIRDEPMDDVLPGSDVLPESDVLPGGDALPESGVSRPGLPPAALLAASAHAAVGGGWRFGPQGNRDGVDALLAALRAAGEGTRLRLLAALAHGELTVSELTYVVRQSQPRVSRHLKLLTQAGLVLRHREGSWVFCRLAGEGVGAALVRWLLEAATSDPALAQDARRLAQVRHAHSERAAAYFRASALKWNEIRAMHVPEEAVERAMVRLAGAEPVETLADLGTGTGRVLEVFAGRVRRSIGFDVSREMLLLARANLARANLEQTGSAHCQVRYGDIYDVPLPDGDTDLVVVHQVLHYLDDPAAALDEAARILRPGGRLLVVDFAPHAAEALRQNHAHRRLGFPDAQISGWLEAAGLEVSPVRHLRPDAPGQLTVSLWLASRPALSGGARATPRLEEAGP